MSQAREIPDKNIRKAYGVLYIHKADGLYVLVGQGSSRGKPRVGDHLPGGTKKAESPLAAVNRECREELAVKGDLFALAHLYTTHELTGTGVRFFYQECDDGTLNGIIDNFNRNPPPVVNKHDLPFKNLVLQKLVDCKFATGYGTEWFDTAREELKAYEGEE